MADSKITALTALTAADPVNDMFPVVDVSDTTMAASGTTKKISVNNILGASGTATLASATITGDLTVRTTGLTVNSSGVGVGTSSQSSFLGNSPKKLVIGDGTQTPALTLYGGSANVSGIYYAKGTVGNQAYRGFFEYDHSADALSFGIAGTNAMTLNSTGNLVLKGGTAGATGVGVTFPATQVASSDANTLDDYEEGTWTPVVTSTAGTLTSVTGQAGAYTKIGRIVTVTGFFQITTNGTGSGSLSVAGLPFTNGALSNTGAGRVDGTTGNMTQVKINATTAIALISKYDNTYPAANGADFPFTITYTTV